MNRRDLLADRDELMAEVAKLRAKCEERKAMLIQHELHLDEATDPEANARIYCPSCGATSGMDHEPDCAWKRAMEDA